MADDIPGYLQRDEWAPVEEALKRAGAKVACPICGTSEWRVFAIGPKHALGGIPLKLSEGRFDIATATFIDAYGMACDNCGFIRLHSSKVLREKMSEGGDGR